MHFGALVLLARHRLLAQLGAVVSGVGRCSQASCIVQVFGGPRFADVLRRARFGGQPTSH
eukprot:5837014-Pyramimonas_sp.AAC.3